MNKPTKDNTKKEHYVPKFYLKKFSFLADNKRDKIWVFNKAKINFFSSNIEDTATSNYFYDFSFPFEEINNKQFDQDLQKLESQIAIFYTNFEEELFCILKADDKTKSRTEAINQNQKETWSEILAVQVLRTVDFRKIVYEVKQKAQDENIILTNLEKMIDESLQCLPFPLGLDEKNILKKAWFNITIQKINSLYSDNIAVIHYHIFCEFFPYLSKVFMNHKWSIGVNQTKMPFYTSDNPIARFPHQETGYATEGIEILFPINSKIIFVLREKNHPKSQQNIDKIFEVNESEVKKYNQAQIYCSNQFIYCEQENFELAQEICKISPEVCLENKNRVKFI